MESERRVTEYGQFAGGVPSRHAVARTMVAISTPKYRPVAPAAGSLYVQLLGGFSVTVGDRRLADADWYLREAMALVKLLALAPNGRLDRRQIIGYVWPYATDVVANHDLDRAIQVTRRVLDRTEMHESQSSFISLSDESIGLSSTSTLTIDVDEFDRAARKAMRAHDPELYDVAVAAYRGDLLPDDQQYEWTAGPRRHLMSMYAALVEARSSSVETAAPLPSGGWLRERPQIA